jgi:hypothetical protein
LGEPGGEPPSADDHAEGGLQAATRWHPAIVAGALTCPP